MAERTPRLVHLVWLGSAVPARVHQLRDDVARHDPDVEVRIWTDDDLAGLRNADELRAEVRMSGKANIARYELLLDHGGMYLDADFRVHRSLAEVFAATDEHGLVVARQSRSVYNPAFIAAAPGHPALARAVEGIPGSRRRFAAMTSPARTGPHYFTSVLMDHLRAGGSFGELPQHAVFPWYSDEDALPAAHLPASVVMSHEWATAGARWSWGEAAEPTDVVRVPDRRTRMRRNGGTVRARAASTPLIHEAIARAERLRDRGGSQRPDPEPVPSETDAVVEGWSAREARRHLRGSATFLDLHPASWLPALAAAQVLDRPGRTIVVRAADAAAPPGRWADRSVRCSVHDVSTATAGAHASDEVVAIRSLGSTLLVRAVGDGRAPVDHTQRPRELSVAGLVAALPRIDLLRARADMLTEATAEAVLGMSRARRIARLLVTIDPLATGRGIDAAAEMLAALEAVGLRIALGPWLVDGRGRTWREHLRGAARPFLVRVGS